MSRSKQKSPFFQYILQNNEQNWIKIFNKGLTIVPRDVNNTYTIYNGKQFIKLRITKEMIGYKFGEFIYTRKKFIFKHKKK